MNTQPDCGCIGHRIPGVFHITACCAVPHITAEQYLQRLNDDARHVAGIDFNEVAMPAPPEGFEPVRSAIGIDPAGPDQPLAYVTEVQQSEDGRMLIASGGWCAPSETIYSIAAEYMPSPVPRNCYEGEEVLPEQCRHTVMCEAHRRQRDERAAATVAETIAHLNDAAIVQWVVNVYPDDYDAQVEFTVGPFDTEAEGTAWLRQNLPDHNRHYWGQVDAVVTV